MLPPYNEHLMRDVVALTLGIAVVLLASVVFMERRLIMTALVAYLTYSVLHTIFHLTHLEGYSMTNVVAQMAVVGLSVAIPAGLLILAWRKTATEVRQERSRQ